MLANDFVAVTDGMCAEQGASGQKLEEKVALWEAECSQGHYLPAATGVTGAQAEGTGVKTPVALMALCGQKVTKVTIAAGTPGRTAGVSQ